MHPWADSGDSGMATQAGDISVSLESPFSADAAALLQALDQDLLARYPQNNIHGVELREVDGGRGLFLVARLNGLAVGCGAIRPLEDSVGEVKRMYVHPDARRSGVARKLLAKLEEEAKNTGYKSLRLETGTRQPEAIALYETHGYRLIPPFGEYLSDPYSVCYEKAL
jgi:GNAT superfamily N-acetyltransferase